MKVHNQKLILCSPWKPTCMCSFAVKILEINTFGILLFRVWESSAICNVCDSVFEFRALCFYHMRFRDRPDLPLCERQSNIYVFVRFEKFKKDYVHHVASFLVLKSNAFQFVSSF